MATRTRKPKYRIPRLIARKPPGTAPGTIRVDPAAPKPTVRAFAYGPDEFVEQAVEDPAALTELMRQWPVVWVNVDGLGDADLLRTLGEMFNLHRLALEDVANVHQRAKVEPYEDQLFVVARMAHLQTDLRTEQVSVFVGEKYVLTFQEQAGDCFDLVRQRIRSGRGLIRRSGAGYLAYALLDALVDAYFPVLEKYGERIEALETEVITRCEDDLIARIHHLKREMLVLRRALWPHREAVNTLLREDSELIGAETRLHLRDCYDHVIQLLDMVETYRELASGLLDVYLSQISNRMNEVMKVLTIFAAIFIPLTFMAGVYGMNFSHMPELTWGWSYPALLLMMALVAGGMLLFFRRRGWLGRRPARHAGAPDAEPGPAEQSEKTK
ncbi:MAG: magnesium/cobalt transporter CorA [Planctomycetota bacterium]|nr:magnesium/cobalt transporter CorA [Planctomycetota bacterium]